MASIELRTPKNKPAYYKITASITLNGQTIRKFSRFDFDSKTLRSAKQRTAAATVAVLNLRPKHRKKPSEASMVVGYDISSYTAMKCFSGAAVTRKTAEVVSKILGVSVRDAFCFERDERPLSKKTIREYVLFANQVLHFANERYHSVQAEFKMPAKGIRPRFIDCIHEDKVKKLMAEISKYPIQEQAIVLSLLNTGVHCAELAGLTWSDFDFKECTVHVNKSLLVFRDFGYQHTAAKESNDRYIDAARSTWHLCSNAKNAGSRYAIS